MKIDTTNVKAPRPLREELADYAHRCWSRWTAHMLEVLEPLIEPPRRGEQRHPTRGVDAAEDAVARWQRQIDTDDADLTEAEQDRSRAIASQYASIVADWLEDGLERLERAHAEKDAADNTQERTWNSERRQGYREAYATLIKTLREIDQ